MHNSTLMQLLVRSTEREHLGITFIESSARKKTISYKELFSNALKATAGLTSIPLRKGDKVILQIQDNEQYLTIFWACLFSGVVPVPLAVGGGEMYREKLLKVWVSLEHVSIIADKNIIDFLSNKEGSKSDLNFDGLLEKCIATHIILENVNSVMPILPQVSESDLAYIQYSSGSTGNPKGIQLSHANLVVNIRDIIEKSDIVETDSMMSWMPLTHDMGLIGIHLTAVVAGVSQRLMPTSLFIRHPLLWLTSSSDFKSTLLYSPNFGFQYCLDAFDANRNYAFDMSSVRLIFNGAEPIQAELCEKFFNTFRNYGLSKDTMYPVYGLAEASLAVTMPLLNSKFNDRCVDRHKLGVGDFIKLVDCSSPACVRLVEVGRPVTNCKVRFCDDLDVPLQDGQVGHLQIKGPNVTKGYYNSKEANEHLFTNDAWLRTGDLGFQFDERVTVIGRSKEVIIINGVKFFSSDIEGTLVRVGLVNAGTVVAAAIPFIHGKSEKFLIFIAFKRALDDFIDLVKSVRAVLYQNFGIHSDAVLPVRKIPKTTSGKVKRFELIDDWISNKFVDVQNRIDEALIQRATSKGETSFIGVCSMAIKINEEDIDRTWTDLGLNSLGATRIVSLLNKSFHCGLLLRDLFEKNTPRSLQKHVESNSFKATKSLDFTPNLQSTRQSLLTSVEERYLLNNLYDRNNSAFNIFVSYEVKGRLDVNHLQDAFNRLILENENLRSSYHFLNGHSVKTILVDTPGTLTYRDMRGQSEVLQEIGNRFINMPFDLSKGVIRGVLFQLEDLRFVFLLVTQQIAADGWSLNVLLKALKGKYEYPLTIPEINSKIQFSHFSDYQLKMLEIGAYDNQKIFWKSEMHGAPQLLNLGNHSRQLHSVTAENNDGYHRYELPVETFLSLKKLCRDYEVTLFSGMCSILRLQFHKYDGASDMFFGINAANRTDELFNEVVGSISNTLPIRTLVHDDTLFGTLLQKMHRTIINALDHQSVPYEYIRKEIEFPEPNVLIVYQNFDVDFSRLGVDTFLHPFSQWSQEQSIVDLHFEFFDVRDTLGLTIRHKRSFINDDQVQKLFDHFIWLIERVCLTPEASIKTLDVISSKEKERLFRFAKGINGNRLPERESVIDQIRKAALFHGDHIALVDGDTCVSYQQLIETVSRIASYFSNVIGLVRGDRIALVTSRSYSTVTQMLAALYGGITYIPIDPAQPLERIRSIIADSCVRIVVSNETYRDQFAELGYIRYAEKKWMTHAYFRVPEFSSERATGIDTNLAYIIYTSGSSGYPKGVMIREEAMRNYVNHFKWFFKVNGIDRVIHQSSISFDTHIEEIYPVLIAGGTCVISSPKSIFNDLIQIVYLEKITILSAVPALISFLNGKVEQLMSLRLLISGGDILYPSMVDKITGRISLFNTYGPSESTVCVAYKEIEVSEEASDLGYPVGGHSIFILDRNRALMPLGFPGEICVSGPGLSDGYLNMVDRTAERFVVSPFESQKMYCTGDIGRWKENGELQFLGRIDSQIKLNGVRIEAGEIEQVLYRSNLLSEVHVIVDAIGSSGGLIAFYSSNNLVSHESLAKHCAKYLPHQMIPARFISVSHFPLKVSGKIDMEALRKMARKGSESQYVSPHSILEKKILSVWEEILNISGIGVMDNFFSLGGESIKAIYVCSLLKEKGIFIEVKDIFVYRTIRSLADKLNEDSQLIIDNDSHIRLKSFSFTQNIIKSLIPVEGKLYQLMVLESRSPIDIKKMEICFQRIFDKHQALRLTCHLREDNLEWMTFSEKVIIDICHYTTTKERDDEIELEKRLLLDRLNRPNNVHWAGVIMKTQDSNHDLLLLASHPFNVDLYSWNVIINDLFDVYEQALLTSIVREELFSQPGRLDRLNKYIKTPQYKLSVDYWDKVRIPKKISVENSAGQVKRIKIKCSDEINTFVSHHSTQNHNVDPSIVFILGIYRSWKEVISQSFPVVAVWDGRRHQTGPFSEEIGTFPCRFPVNLEALEAVDSSMQVLILKQLLGEHAQHSYAYEINDIELLEHFLGKAPIRFDMLGNLGLSELNMTRFSISEFDDTPLISSLCQHRIIIRSYSIDGKCLLELHYDKTKLADHLANSFLALLTKYIAAIILELYDSQSFEFTPSDFESLDIDNDDLSSLFK